MRDRSSAAAAGAGVEPEHGVGDELLALLPLGGQHAVISVAAQAGQADPVEEIHGCRSSRQSRRDPHGVGIAGYRVDPHAPRSGHGGVGGQRDRRVVTFGERARRVLAVSEQPRDEALARRPDQHGKGAAG